MSDDGTTRARGRQRGRILIVCTANQCRSPMAELMLQRALEPLADGPVNWIVRSAGVHAEAGLPLDPVAQQVLLARNLDPALHRSRRLNSRMVRDADLILTAERSHRSAVVAVDPGVLPHSFTLLQFARLLAVPAPEEVIRPDGRRFVAGLLRRAQWARPLSEPGDARDDLPDPIGRGARHMQKAATRIENAVVTIVDAINAAERARLSS